MIKNYREKTVKVQERKDKQGWTKDAPKCSNCAGFSSEMVRTNYGWMDEKNIKCLRGDFATKKTAWCKMWKRKGVK